MLGHSMYIVFTFAYVWTWDRMLMNKLKFHVTNWVIN